MERTPPNIHANSTMPTLVRCWATEWGDRKMPEPMMLPTVMAVAAYSPITRGSSGADFGVPAADGVSVAMRRVSKVRGTAYRMPWRDDQSVSRLIRFPYE